MAVRSAIHSCSRNTAGPCPGLAQFLAGVGLLGLLVFVQGCSSTIRRFNENGFVYYDVVPGTRDLSADLDDVRRGMMGRAELFKTPIIVDLYQHEDEFNNSTRDWAPIRGISFKMPLAQMTEAKHVEFTHANNSGGVLCEMSIVPRDVAYRIEDIGVIHIDFTFEELNQESPEYIATWYKDPKAWALVPEIAQELDEERNRKFLIQNVLVRYVISGSTTAPVKFGPGHFFLDKLLLPGVLQISPPKSVPVPEKSN